MPHSLLIQFEQHPQERELIGKLILTYGELEFMLQDMLRASLGNDTMTATRTLYRVRSEAQRLTIADALIRPKMEAQGLLNTYLDAHSAMFHCKQIRNGYTHAQWLNDEGVLRFGDLDLAAKSTGSTAAITFKAVTLQLLQRQFDYFAYAEHALMYATNQYRLKTNQPLPRGAVIPKPRKMRLPTLDSLRAERSRLENRRDKKTPESKRAQ